MMRASKRLGPAGLLRKLSGRSARELALMTEAVVVLAAARLAARLLPFQWVMSPARAPLRRAPPPDAADLAVREVTQAVTRVSRHVVFRAACLQQALAVRGMLARRGVETVLHFGAAMEADEGLRAHAWLSRGETVIVGAGPATRYAQLAEFPARRAAGTAA
jgi:hypothetical protein